MTGKSEVILDTYVLQRLDEGDGYWGIEHRVGGESAEDSQPCGPGVVRGPLKDAFYWIEVHESVCPALGAATPSLAGRGDGTEFTFHPLSECPGEATCPVHGENMPDPTEGQR